MRVLVNALSLGSLSGQHVLYGHVRQLAEWTVDTHEFVVLHQPTTSPLPLLGENVTFWQAPRLVRNWMQRTVWEATVLPRRIRHQGFDLYFTPSGTILPHSTAKQVSLSQNPWCMVPRLTRSFAERLKAKLQRAAYRQAFRRADQMVFNSQHMHDLCASNAATAPASPPLIAYQGIDDTTHEAGRAARESGHPRSPLSIVSVSVMAHWKGVEMLVAALARLRARDVPARLTLVGPWPDPLYRRQIEAEIARAELTECVTITGHVTREELHRHYASAQVFCLLSRCESFGIPAIEAQAFGTPVVGSNVCAMPEICGPGGTFHHPDDIDAVATSLERLLTDNAEWSQVSRRAVQNVERYRWNQCSRPLLKIFDLSQAS